MQKRIAWCAAAIAASGALLQTGCGDDRDPKPDAPDAGADAATGGSTASGGGGAGGGNGGSGGGTGGNGTGGNGTGGNGTGGNGTGGAGTGGNGTGGVPEGGLDADAGVDAASEGGDAADAGADSGLLLAVATDFFSASEVAAVDLQTRTVTGNINVADGDVGVTASGGRGFVIERTNDRVHVLGATGQIARTIELRTGDSGAGLNPHDVVVVPGDGEADRGYVSLYDASRIDVFDLESGDRLQSIDLSALLDPADQDGSVDVDAGVYVPGTGLVYFVLHRTDLTTATLDTDFQVLCPTVPSLLVAVDPETNTLADLNGADPGEALALTLVSASDLDYDESGDRLFLVSNGCAASAAAGDAGVDGGGVLQRQKHGVEVVTLDDLSASVAYAPQDTNFYNRLFLLDDTTGLVEHFDESFTTLISLWPLGSASFDGTLTGVPSAPVVLSPRTLLGLSIAATDAGPEGSVVRYSVASETATTLVSGIWTGSLGNVGAAALVR